MNESLRVEKRILKISLLGSVLFLAVECIAAFITGSHALLTDCVYDFADLLMVGPFLLLVPLLYKPETEKRPYGFSQVESLFIMIKCVLLIFVTSQMVIESVQAILSGGNHVNAAFVAVFELGVSAICASVYFSLTRMNRKYSSPTAKIEIYIWKLDALSTLGVGLAFLVQLWIQKTAFSWLAPYVDPAIAIIMGVILLKEPAEMLWEGIKNLILFAPKKEIVEHVREVADSHLQKHSFHVNFLDVIKTGRKLWVEVYILQDEDWISVKELKQMREEIMGALKKEYDNIHIELIPELENTQIA